MAKEVELRIPNHGAMKPVFDNAWELVRKGLQAGEVVLTLGRPKRSNVQNRKMWAMLRDVSQQVSWYGQDLSSEDWKHVFTASVCKQKAVPGIDGGFVVLGLPTRKMSKTLFRDLIEVIYAFGANAGVHWSDPVEREYLAQLEREIEADRVKKAA